MIRRTRLFASLRVPAPARMTNPSHLRLSQRRLIGTTPPAQKSRSFRSSLVRWGIALGAVYWYTTRDVDVFAEDARGRLRAAQAQKQQYVVVDTHQGGEQLRPGEDPVLAGRLRQQVAAREVLDAPTGAAAAADPAPATSSSAAPDADAVATSAPELNAAAAKVAVAPAETVEAPLPPSPAELEEEASTEGAFNEETGEINWDCPCLGGMAHGPCGPQFREAFSCFVFSQEEPKGVDCIERFKTMQECFREHPDVYGAELTDDLEEDQDPTSADAGAAAAQTQSQSEPGEQSSTATAPSSSTQESEPQKASDSAS